MMRFFTCSLLQSEAQRATLTRILFLIYSQSFGQSKNNEDFLTGPESISCILALSKPIVDQSSYIYNILPRYVVPSTFSNLRAEDSDDRTIHYLHLFSINQ
jgi:hypothetical protein